MPKRTTKLAPVAAFLYKRPQHVRRMLSSLAASRLAQETDLFLFCDGAQNPADEPAVRAAREEARRVTGFRSVTVIERTENWGLSRSITTAVADLCEGFGRVIAVEDDLVLAPGFLDFMNHALARYEAEERVMQISGFQFGLRSTPPSHNVFLPLISCWGWATWKRAWRAYDPQGRGGEAVLADADRRRRFNLEGAYDYASLLRNQLEGRVDSWGVRWYLSVFDRDGLVLFPPRSLASNEGFDGSGTHKVNQTNSLAAGPDVWPDPATFLEPERIEVSAQALAEVKGILREASRPRGLLARLKMRLSQ